MIKLVSNILVCCSLAVPTLGETPLLANALARSSLSLNGTWRVIPDPYETGLRGRYFLNRKPASKSSLVEYDFDSAWPLKVPGDWNSEREDLLFYEGPVWYERSFLYHRRLDSIGRQNRINGLGRDSRVLGQRLGKSSHARECRSANA